MQILHKIKNRIKMTTENFKSDMQFSMYYAFLRVISDYASRFRLTTIADWAHKKREDWIIDYLEDILSDVIEKYKDNNNIGEYTDNAPIWVCWWTGIETAPALVKQCINSIYNNSNGHLVNFITKDNYQDYLDIPDYIIEKVNSKKMCLANFSDYLRFALMAKYGGLWIDATIYVSKDLPENYFANPVFSCKSETTNCNYISRYRWTSFLFYTWKNNTLSNFFKDCFEEYWKSHDVAIDYLLVDYIINSAYNNNIIIRNIIDKIPINNVHRDDLQAAMNNALPATEFNSIIKDDTILYKLSWRETYKEINSEGKDTVYKHFLSLD